MVYEVAWRDWTVGLYPNLPMPFDVFAFLLCSCVVAAFFRGKLRQMGTVAFIRAVKVCSFRLSAEELCPTDNTLMLKECRPGLWTTRFSETSARLAAKSPSPVGVEVLDVEHFAAFFTRKLFHVV
jgi:hypothetical protein